MPFYADLHIHSKYSMATSWTCDLEHLSLWARKKGIAVLGTGDFTHPAWRAELQAKLTPAEPGLFQLRPESEHKGTVLASGKGTVLVSKKGTVLASPRAGTVPFLAGASPREQKRDCPRESPNRDCPFSCGVNGHTAIPAPPTRFMLSAEIATIYKKDGRTRKVHHLIYVPGFMEAAKIAKCLAQIGNLEADGRPILGLDSRDLLEIVLDTGNGAYLVPAHIWTPWFSVLGSKSGFDSIEECYGDLAPHIFALETGLSSDPAMNWRLSALDRCRLVSNSDAHSPQKLGREACVFNCAVDYFAMRDALETGDGYGGTIEFYPEEGKYHLDGHRKCGVRLTPAETRRHNGACPVCGKPVTIGVMHRVEELADRRNPQQPHGAAPFRSLIPLTEILAEVEGVGASTKHVTRRYTDLLDAIGPELYILENAPLDQLRQHGSQRLAAAIRRMRQGNVIRHPGFDGQYGNIRLFPP